MELLLAQPVPGLFIRVDLERGTSSLESCYASEFAYATAIGPQPSLGVSKLGFTKSPRPGSTCDGPSFQATSASVRVFDAADPFARTPVGGGSFFVSLTVTE